MKSGIPKLWVSFAALLALAACSSQPKPTSMPQALNEQPRANSASRTGGETTSAPTSNISSNSAPTLRPMPHQPVRPSDPMVVPSLDHPVQLAAGDHHVCALDNEGVKCWRGPYNNKRAPKDLIYGQLDVPELRNPRGICAAENHSCAIDDDGIKCWGTMTEEPLATDGSGRMIPVSDGPNTFIPPTRNPRMLTCGSGVNCVSDDFGLKCWTPSSNSLIAAVNCSSAGRSARESSCTIKRGFESFFGASEPHSLTIQDLFQNHVADSSLIDKGSSSDSNRVRWARSTLAIPTLENIRGYAISDLLGICALHARGTTCWGGWDSVDIRRDRPPSDTENYLRISMGGLNGCVIRSADSQPDPWNSRAGRTYVCFGSNQGFLAGAYSTDDDVNRAAPRELKSPQEIAVNNGHICALQNGEVFCWGRRKDDGSPWPGPNVEGSYRPSKNMAIKNPRALVAGGDFNCVLDDEGAKCW